MRQHLRNWGLANWNPVHDVRWTTVWKNLEPRKPYPHTRLTGVKAQIFASVGAGLLSWADVISVEVPFYFLNKTTFEAMSVPDAS
jgi:hypothetical protein